MSGKCTDGRGTQNLQAGQGVLRALAILSIPLLSAASQSLSGEWKRQRCRQQFTLILFPPFPAPMGARESA